MLVPLEETNVKSLKNFWPIASAKWVRSSSFVGFMRILVSYVRAKIRRVLLVLFASRQFNKPWKPEIIEFYNATKIEVDSLDQKCAVFSCNRRTRRKFLVIFYALLNITAVNSHVLLNFSVENLEMSRRSFIKKMGLLLIEEHIRRL